MAWVAVGAAAVGAGGAYLSSKNNAKAAQAGQTTQQQMDPRISEMLLGNGDAGSSGLLQQWAGSGNPMTGGQNTFGQTSNDYLSNYSGADTEQSRNAIYNAMRGNTAPQSGGTQSGMTQSGAGPQVGAFGQGQTDYVTGESVNAPAQNNINLTSTFGSLLGGGNNTALMQSLQAGNALTSAQQQQNQSDMTQNLQRNVLPGIRSGAIASGQYGGSRQGIAEGNAISDFTKQLNNSNTQIGLANSANTASQLANSYETGQNRSLAAAQGLSGQQYGVASQNSSQAQQANLSNQNASNSAQQLYAQNAQAASLANAQLGQSNNQFNANLGQANNQFNANLGQNNNQFNAGQQQQTNNQNTSSALAGSGMLSSLLQQQSGNAANYNNYGMNQAQQLSGILAPYASANGSSTTTAPSYSNTAGGLLGGAAAGLGLYNQFKNSGQYNTTPNAQNIAPGTY